MKRAKIQKELAPYWLKSGHGNVRIYVRRHVGDCLFTSKNETSCMCPKWLYANPKNGAAYQRAAETPSFAEAVQKARDLMRGWDPEIAKAREITNPTGTAVSAAVDKYMTVLRNRGCSASYVDKLIRAVFIRRPKYQKRSKNLTLLDFIDQHNQTAVEPVLYVHQIENDLLEQWAESWGSNDLTSAQWRNVTNSLLIWAHRRGMFHGRPLPSFGDSRKRKPGNRCGHFTDEQYQKIIASLPYYAAAATHKAGKRLPENYVPRMRAFIELGRWSGMAIIDLIRFSPAEHLTGDVITYRRKKNGQIAIATIPQMLAEWLRHIPAEEKMTDPERPFRLGDDDDNVTTIWRERFQAVCKFAGVREIVTEVGKRIQPHPHMLRDTFAIDMILRGVGLDIVAKALGHATTDQTQRAYLFWIKKREEYAIQQQRAALANVALAPFAPASTAVDLDRGVRRRALVN